MDKRTAIEVAQHLTALLEEEGMDIDKTILFGSCARDEADEESDVDIAVISEDFQDKNFRERARLTMKARSQTIRDFLVPIDLLRFTPAEYASSTSLAAQFARSDGILVNTPPAEEQEITPAHTAAHPGN